MPPAAPSTGPSRTGELPAPRALPLLQKLQEIILKTTDSGIHHYNLDRKTAVSRNLYKGRGLEGSGSLLLSSLHRRRGGPFHAVCPVLHAVCHKFWTYGS